MVWKERKDHITDNYFCTINLKGKNSKTKHQVQYPDVPFAIRPISHGSDVPVPKPDGNMEYDSDSKHSDMTVVVVVDAYLPEEDNQPVPLTRDLNISKEAVLLLGSRLKKKRLLALGTTFYWYRDHERELR